jgi:hypothetical protein
LSVWKPTRMLSLSGQCVAFVRTTCGSGQHTICCAWDGRTAGRCAMSTVSAHGGKHTPDSPHGRNSATTTLCRRFTESRWHLGLSCGSCKQDVCIFYINPYWRLKFICNYCKTIIYICCN